MQRVRLLRPCPYRTHPGLSTAAGLIGTRRGALRIHTVADIRLPDLNQPDPEPPIQIVSPVVFSRHLVPLIRDLTAVVSRLLGLQDDGDQHSRDTSSPKNPRRCRCIHPPRHRSLTQPPPHTRIYRAPRRGRRPKGARLGIVAGHPRGTRITACVLIAQKDNARPRTAAEGAQRGGEERALGASGVGGICVGVG
jgi:hypothetical protein